MQRSRAAMAAVIVGLLGVSVIGSVSIAEAQLKYTGCLKQNGKIVRIAPGDSPSKPCKDNQTEVMFTGTEKTDALMDNDMLLMDDVTGLQAKTLELMEKVDDLQAQIDALTKCGTGQLLNGDGVCVADPNACASDEVLLGGGGGCFPANLLSGYPCGNGQLDDGEQCDDGFWDNGPDAICNDSCEWNCRCDFFAVPFPAWSGKPNIEFKVDGTSCTLRPPNSSPFLGVDATPNTFSCASGNLTVEVASDLSQTDVEACARAIELYSTQLDALQGISVAGANAEGEYICPIGQN